MIKHIVFWSISPSENKARHNKVLKEFTERCKFLEAVIPQFNDYRIALNTEEGENNFHLCIDSCFPSKDDLDAYIMHPEHLKVREWLNEVTDRKTVFDYEY